MGIMTTRYGSKPMVKFTFELDEPDGFGGKRRLTRLFHNHTHPKSAVSAAVKKWCDRDLQDEEENGGTDWQSFVNQPACIRIEPGNIVGNRHYENITDIVPLNDGEIGNNETKEND